MTYNGFKRGELMAIRRKLTRLCRITGGLAVCFLCIWCAAHSVPCISAAPASLGNLERVSSYAFLPAAHPVGQASLTVATGWLEDAFPALSLETAVVQLVRHDYARARFTRLFPARPPEPSSRETICYGRSGAGRKLLAYRFGTGENVLIVTFAIHGWEDNFEQDGQLLVDTGNLLIETLTDQYASLIVPGDWTVYVLPCLNPDGLYDGWTCDGPGRCTTHSLNEDGLSEEGSGMDLNRCFLYRFSSDYSPRNYCGSEPLRAREALALAQFTQSVMGDGLNILIDTHGWYQQIIPSGDRSGTLFQTFSDYFPGNSYASLRSADGYYSAWAAYTLGYDACLFEFPHVSSAQDFQEKGYGQDYVDAICAILETYGSDAL